MRTSLAGVLNVTPPSGVLPFVLSLWCATALYAEDDVSKLRLCNAAISKDLFCWTDTCNVYVLRDGDAALLFDLGDGSVLEQLPKIGVKKVEWLLLTHHHREQCQGVDQLDCNKTQIAVSKVERELLESPMSFRNWHPKLGDKYSVYGASYVRPPRHPIKIDKALADGETFAWRGHEIHCLLTPGHSPGSMTYLLKFGKKTIAVSGGILHDGAKMTTWFDSEWDYGFAKGLDALVDSVDALADESPDVLLPSHGPMIRNAGEQLKTYTRKLATLRKDYVRGYPVFDSKPEERDAISVPTQVTHINRVTKHLYKLSHKTKGKNFAIIVSDRGHGLILDAGLFPESMLDEIILGMREHLGLKQIDAFWISHMHGDHFLLGPTLKRKYGAQAWTLDRIADRCEFPRRYDYAALVAAYGDGFDGMKIDKTFRDGESIMWEGYKIQVDWMPGQTEFGCCLWLDIDGKRVAFTGDNLFGNAADEKQNGHEAVVARNSAVFEDGYIHGSQYLMNLKPDIVMGSHSYVMHDPANFLERYHNWSKRISQLYRDLLPQDSYEYGFDPYWVSAYPYRVDLSQLDQQRVLISVRNFHDRVQWHRIELRLPPGVTADRKVIAGGIPAKRRQYFPVTLTVDRNRIPAGVQIATFDITLDGHHHGELFDFVIRAK